MRSLRTERHAARLVDAALGRFGRIDAAVAFSGRIVTGRVLDSATGQFVAYAGGWV